MKKKIIVALGIGIVVVVGAGTVYATRSQKAKSSSDQAYELGQMIQEQDKETDTSDELYAVGKDIQITKQEMKNYEKRFALGEEDAQDSVTDDGKSSEEKAFQALVRRKTLAVAAETAGIQSVMQNWIRSSAKSGKPWIQASMIRKIRNTGRH